MRKSMIAIVAALAFAVTIPGTSQAADDDHIDRTATSTYEAVPGKGYVNVTVTMHIRNWVPSVRTPYSCTDYYYDYWLGLVPIEKTCYRTTDYYVNSTALLVEKEAKKLRVLAGGRTLSVKKIDSSANYRAYKVAFPKIFYGGSRTIKAVYRIPGGKPRSATDVRINPAYLHFWAISQPYADVASVKIRVPKTYETSTTGGDVTASVVGAARVLSSGSVDPSTYFVGVTGNDPNGFAEQVITTPDGRGITVQGWPGDNDWMTSVAGETSSSIAKIEELIGQPIPGTGPIAVREVASNELGDAYVGVFDSDEQVANISEDFQQRGLVTHELSHAWFNSDLFKSTWMSEGYAQWMERATGVNPVACAAPASFPGTGKANLGDWQYASPRATDDEFAMVQYEYDASCAIVSQIADKIGNARMRDVLTVLSNSERAYAGIPGATSGQLVDWAAWLDAVDERGMLPAGLEDTHTVADILVKYGIATKDDLLGREKARSDFDRLRAQSNGWAVPPVIPRSMFDWSFDAAEAEMSEVAATRSIAGEVQSVLPEIEADSSIVRPDVEQATSLADLKSAHARVTSQLEAARAVVAAADAADQATEPLQQLGLLGTDLPGMQAAAVAAVAAGNMDAARDQAAAIAGLAAGAGSVGTSRLAIGISVAVAMILLLGIVLFLIRRSRRNRRSAAWVDGTEDAMPVFGPPNPLDALAASSALEPANQHFDAIPSSPAMEPPT